MSCWFSSIPLLLICLSNYVASASLEPEAEQPTLQCVNLGGKCFSGDQCTQENENKYDDCDESECCSSDFPPPPTSEGPPEEPVKDCGHRNAEGIKFESQDRENGESEFGEFPWMVAIFAEGRTDSGLICGGSLIDPGVVVTTAHCVKSFKSSPEKLIIRAGEWDMGSKSEPIGYEERRVEKIKSHPAFKATTLVNNIALLFLDDKFDLSQTINTICLPPQGFTIDNGRVTATGWGSTPKERSKQILKSFELEYFQRAECERTLRKVVGNRSFKLDRSFICAGGEPGVDTCKGDAGSPIIYPIPEDADERYYAVGLVSWGVGCGRPGIPAAYTNIGQFRNWIDEQLEAEDIQNHNYQYQKQSAETE